MIKRVTNISVTVAGVANVTTDKFPLTVGAGVFKLKANAALLAIASSFYSTIDDRKATVLTVSVPDTDSRVGKLRDSVLLVPIAPLATEHVKSILL